MSSTVHANRRRHNRITAVLPVKVRGIDAAGAAFDGLAHTLDLTPTGARLGAIRHQMKALDKLTVFYKQRRMDFTVMWTKLLDGKAEYQVGLQALAQEKEPWGVSFLNCEQPGTKASAATIGTI